MSNSENGSLEFSAVVLIIFMSAIITGGLLYMDVIRKYQALSFYKSDDCRSARERGLEIMADFTMLADTDHDSDFCDILHSIRSKYKKDGVKIEDISSRVNVAFMSYEDFQSKEVSKTLFINDTADALVADIKNGLLPSRFSDLRKYIKTDALEYCTVYGWMPVINIKSPAFEYISRIHGTESPEKLYPLINSVPSINVNYVDKNVLTLYLKNKKYEIKKPDEKIAALSSLTKVRGVDRGMLSSILDVPYTNAIFSVLGVKTSFWKVEYVSGEQRYCMIVCAVPLKEDESKIEGYELLSWGKYRDDEWNQF